MLDLRTEIRPPRFLTFKVPQKAQPPARSVENQAQGRLGDTRGMKTRKSMMKARPTRERWLRQPHRPPPLLRPTIRGGDGEDGERRVGMQEIRNISRIFILLRFSSRCWLVDQSKGFR